MSTELLPSTPKYKKEWHVRKNYCQCHPETCCCNDWAVHKPDGEKCTTFFNHKDAVNYADLMNAYHGHTRE